MIPYAYFYDIGRIPLLEHDEEILLGQKVQRLMEIKEIEKELEVTSKEDLAKVLGISIKELRKQSRDGEKQKTKWLQRTYVSSSVSSQEVYKA